MPVTSFETGIAARYAALGLAAPTFERATNPERFDALVAEARIAAILASDIDIAAVAATRCPCPGCLGLDITAQVTPFMPSPVDRRRLALIAPVIDTGNGVRALSIRGHRIERDTPPADAARRDNIGMLWATAWDRSDDELPTAGVDAWMCTPSTCVLLVAGSWRYDDDGCLHDGDGIPAMVWPGGWSASYEHGIHIPRWATDPANLTVERINNVSNIEVRRILARRLGYDWFFENDPYSELVDDDPRRGQLWELGRTYGESPRLLRVVDATPTPGGDRKVYWLAVPPNVDTAQAAVAWTFGLEPDDYAPEVET